jgi:excisionase family DNA binding protein
VDKERLYSIAELARLLSVSPTAVRKWIDAGTIKAPKLRGGAAKLFTPEEVETIKRTIAKRRRSRRKEAKR